MEILFWKSCFENLILKIVKSWKFFEMGNLKVTLKKGKISF